MFFSIDFSSVEILTHCIFVKSSSHPHMGGSHFPSLLLAIIKWFFIVKVGEGIPAKSGVLKCSRFLCQIYLRENEKSQKLFWYGREKKLACLIFLSKLKQKSSWPWYQPLVHVTVCSVVSYLLFTWKHLILTSGTYNVKSILLKRGQVHAFEYLTAKVLFHWPILLKVPIQ